MRLPKAGFTPLVAAIGDGVPAHRIRGAIRGAAIRGRGIASQVNWTGVDLDAFARAVALRSSTTGLTAGAVAAGLAVAGVIYVTRSSRAMRRKQAAATRADAVPASEPPSTAVAEGRAFDERADARVRVEEGVDASRYQSDRPLSRTRGRLARRPPPPLTRNDRGQRRRSALSRRRHADPASSA